MRAMSMGRKALAAWLSIGALVATASYPYPFLDPALPRAERVADLLGRLSLDEKVAQLSDNTGAVPRLNISAQAFRLECDSGIGPVGYPQSIGMAATFNRTAALLQGRGIGVMLRARARGGVQGLSCFSPMMNLMRHPNWGRNHEGYGECPYLTGEMAFNMVQGLQGLGLAGYPHYALGAATCKHFSAFTGPGNAVGIISLTDADWFWNYLPHFERCVEAGAVSMMCSYGLHRYVDSDAGVPALPEPALPPKGANATWFDCADPRALTTVLRDTWGMGDDSFVVSDCGGVHDANTSLRAGLDMDCQATQYPKLANLTRSGVVPEDLVDRAVRRVLGARMRLGEFDPVERVPFRDAAVYNATAETVAAYTSVSLEAARQSITLLKNDGTLPWGAAGLRRVAVVGIDGYMFAEYDTADGGFVTEPFPNDAYNTSVTDALNLALGLRTICHADTIVGCYDDDGGPLQGVLNFTASQKGVMARTHDECAGVCFRLGFAEGYFGLQSGTQCRCGAAIRPDGGGGVHHPPRPLEECAEPCPGNHSQPCGGVHRTLVGKVQCRIEGGAPGSAVRFVPGCFDGPRCAFYDRDAVLEGASNADAVVVLAGTGGLEGEGKDMTDLQLQGRQYQMIEDVLSAGRPTTLVLFTCTPVNITHYVNDSRLGAIIQAFYPQQMGGHAVVDVLLGRYNPSGRLPYTWPTSLAKAGAAGQLDYSMLGGNSTYRYNQPNPLFPFGYGLSFTTFRYSDLTMSPASSIQPCDVIHLSVTVTNAGAVDGAEVVQLYLHWVNPGQLVPKLQLANFTKIEVSAGMQRRVELAIDARRMALLKGPAPSEATWSPPQWWVFPGAVEVSVGGGQPGFAETLNGRFTIVGAAQPVAECSGGSEMRFV